VAGQTYLDLLTQAAGELNVVAMGDSLANNPTLAQWLLDRLYWLIDSWNLDPTFVPWYQQKVFNLVPGQQSYLIGLNSPDWNAQTPVRLSENATNLLLTNPSTVGPNQGGFLVNSVYTNSLQVGAPPYNVNVNSAAVGLYPVQASVNGGPYTSYPAGTPLRIPLEVLSVQAWANISLPTLSITFPQACYLDRSVVTGTNPITGLAYTATRFWVWGVPTNVNQIELFYWYALTVGSLTDTVNVSTGYFRAMFLNLAVEIASAFGVTPSAVTMRNAADALALIKELSAPDMTMAYAPGVPKQPSGGYLTRSQFLSGVF